jgi:predicted phage tail protein
MKTKIKIYGKLGRKFRNEFEFFNISKPSDSIKAINSIYPDFRIEIQNQSQNGIEYQMIVNGEILDSWKMVNEKKRIETIEIAPTIIGSDPVTIVTSLVVSLVVAGITYLMTPIPEIVPQEMTQEVSASSQSYIFGSNANLAAQGQSVPLRYGLLRIGSSIISSRITNENFYTKGNTSKYIEGLYSTDFAPASGPELFYDRNFFNSQTFNLNSISEPQPILPPPTSPFPTTPT